MCQGIYQLYKNATLLVIFFVETFADRIGSLAIVIR